MAIRLNVFAYTFLFSADFPSQIPGRAVAASVYERAGAATSTEAEAALTVARHLRERLSAWLAELLIANGADVNAEDQDGSTPLTFAELSEIAHRTTGVADVLRKHGAREGQVQQ